jgi:hypothetical protein
VQVSDPVGAGFVESLARPSAATRSSQHDALNAAALAHVRKRQVEPSGYGDCEKYP